MEASLFIHNVLVSLYLPPTSYFKMSTFLDLKTQLKTIIAESIGVLTTTAVNYFEQRITEQTDISGNAFAGRKPELSSRRGRAILIQSGNLRRSIQPKEITPTSVTISADISVGSGFDYAQIHNEGGEITITAKMKKFFWAKYYETSGKTRQTKAGKTAGKARKTKANESISEDAKIWKNMALKKVGDTITIPQRQFIGESAELKRLLEAALQDFLNNNS